MFWRQMPSSSPLSPKPHLSPFPSQMRIETSHAPPFPSLGGTTFTCRLSRAWLSPRGDARRAQLRQERAASGMSRVERPSQCHRQSCAPRQVGTKQ